MVEASAVRVNFGFRRSHPSRLSCPKSVARFRRSSKPIPWHISAASDNVVRSCLDAEESPPEIFIGRDFEFLPDFYGVWIFYGVAYPTPLRNRPIPRTRRQEALPLVASPYISDDFSLVSGVLLYRIQVFYGRVL